VRAVLPSVAVDRAGVTHVVYNQAGRLYYTHTQGGGFVPAMALDAGLGATHAWIVRGLPGELHVLYLREATDKTLYHRRGAIAGGTAAWSARVAIAGNPASKAYPGIAVADASGTLHVPYIENTCGQYRVFYRAPRKDGIWTAPELPVPTCEYQTTPQAIVSADNRVQMVFRRGTDVAFASREASGWTAMNLSSSPATNSYAPSIARMFGSYLFVAWDEGVNGHDIQARISPDSGRTWGALLMISSSPQFATAPTVEWLSGTTRVGVAWADATGSVDNQPDLLYAEVDVLSRGMTPPVRLGTFPGPAMLPALSVLGGGSLVWQDKTSGDWQIFASVDPGA
jgi:hypothetical protein